MLIELAERNCGTCRYWDRLSMGSTKGDCRAPDNHRYAKVLMPNGTYAMLDSFGPEETIRTHRCGAWRQAQPEGPLDVSEHAAALRARA